MLGRGDLLRLIFSPPPIYGLRGFPRRVTAEVVEDASDVRNAGHGSDGWHFVSGHSGLNHILVLVGLQDLTYITHRSHDIGNVVAVRVISVHDDNAF
jgi:hypothetical protein